MLEGAMGRTDGPGVRGRGRNGASIVLVLRGCSEVIAPSKGFAGAGISDTGVSSGVGNTGNIDSGSSAGNISRISGSDDSRARGQGSDGHQGVAASGAAIAVGVGVLAPDNASRRGGADTGPIGADAGPINACRSVMMSGTVGA